MAFDGARRLTTSDYVDTLGDPVFAESLAWSSRSLNTNRLRGDLNGAGFGYSYDPAGRLTQAFRVGSDVASPEVRSFAALPEHFGFTYDAAENLLAQTSARACEADVASLPLDGSGRNRPGSVAGTPVSWDPAGNLTGKGDRELVYDADHRLTRVLAADGTELAHYEYDAFGRRVRSVVAGITTETAWADWQPIEEYRDGQLFQRRTYGVGLDEMVALEADLTGDGVIDQEYLRFYDASGSLVLLTDPTGRPVERYEYSPFGERWILVDSTPPAIEQIRVVGAAVVVELSEEVLLAEIAEAIASGELTLTDRTDPTLPVEIGLTASQPVRIGRPAGRRIVLTPDPEEVPAAGAPLDLVIPASALRDLFGNLAPTGATESLAWPASGGALLVRDDVAPRIEEVCLTGGGFLEVTLSEPADPARVGSVFAIDGSPVGWSVDPDGYTLRTSTVLASGSHTLSASTDPLDLAGLGLSAAWSETFSVSASILEVQVFSAPHPGLSFASTVGNTLGFHGLSHDSVTGFVYARHRYLDPELGRFVTTDPMGYVDGPNLYQYALNNSVSFADPLGLESFEIQQRHREAVQHGFNPYYTLTMVEGLAAVAEDLAPYLADPRVQGTLQVVGGCTEAGLGGAAITTGGLSC